MKNIKKIKKNVIVDLKKAFSSVGADFSENALTLIHEGRFANAVVLRYRDKNFDLTIKDFSGSPRLIRGTFGFLSTRTEFRAKKALAEALGETGRLYRLSPWSLAFDYVRGETLSKVPKMVSSEYFIQMERIVRKLHDCGFVHLDLRNQGNMILGRDGAPHIIDFQSCLPTKYLPSFLRCYLERVDFSGVYKAWERKCSVALDRRRKAVLTYVNGIRKFWIFKGYPLQHFMEKRKMMRKV